jgi:hypothetical protein
LRRGDKTFSYVAVGLLTQRDLDALGSDFRRAFPITDNTEFDELLRKLDEVTRDRGRP